MRRVARAVLFRRWRWRRKVNVNPIDLIEDPREAAGVIMVAVAQADGRLTAAEQGRHLQPDPAALRCHS